MRILLISVAALAGGAGLCLAVGSVAVFLVGALAGSGFMLIQTEA